MLSKASRLESFYSTCLAVHHGKQPSLPATFMIDRCVLLNLAAEDILVSSRVNTAKPDLRLQASSESRPLTIVTKLSFGVFNNAGWCSLLVCLSIYHKR